MWELIDSSEAWQLAGTSLAWLTTSCLLLVGLVGCVVPVLPGHWFLLLAAVGHRLMLGAEGSGLAWWSFLILLAMMAISQAMEIMSGAAGAKWFGGTKWGALGALVGTLVGLFFLPLGLLAGPLLGAFGFELAFARREAKAAVASGIGSVAGTVVGMVVKLTIGVMMILWFLLDVFWIGNR
jgi:uncharacterized protein